jgi:hypothetical protein
VRVRLDDEAGTSETSVLPDYTARHSRRAICTFTIISGFTIFTMVSLYVFSVNDEVKRLAELPRTWEVRVQTSARRLAIFRRFVVF